MIYVMSDIHGNREAFDEIMAQINLSLTDSLYILGDVIDRYPGGLNMIRQIMDMRNVYMLLGNHEQMMMQALGIKYQNEPFVRKQKRGNNSKKELQEFWYFNGGKVTHEEWKRLSFTTRRKIEKYLGKLPLNYRIQVRGKKYTLVHAAPVELYKGNDLEYDNVIDFAVWSREAINRSVEGDSTLVFGHTVTCYMQDNDIMEIWKADKKIGIDCGAGFSKGHYAWKGRLACLRLDDMQVFYSS